MIGFRAPGPDLGQGTGRSGPRHGDAGNRPQRVGQKDRAARGHVIGIQPGDARGRILCRDARPGAGDQNHVLVGLAGSRRGKCQEGDCQPKRQPE